MSTSIDDLLVHEDEPPPRVRRQRRGGWWVRTALIVAGLTAVTVVGLRMVDLETSVFLIAAGFFALLAVRRAATLVMPPPARRRGSSFRNTSNDDRYHWGARDALPGAVKRWEKALAVAEGNRDWVSLDIVPMLTDLVDERLRQRHGCTRESDPARARALLGEPLWNFLTVPARRGPTQRDWAAVVAKLETL